MKLIHLLFGAMLALPICLLAVVIAATGNHIANQLKEHACHEMRVIYGPVAPYKRGYADQ